MKKVASLIDKYIIYILIFLSFLFYCRVTENTKIISFLLWPTMIIAMIDIIYKIISNYKQICKNRTFWGMNLFLFSFLISMIVGHKYGIYKNFRTMIYMVIMFYIVYLQFVEKSSNDKSDILNKVCIEFFSIATILALVSLIIIPMSFTEFNVLGTSKWIEGIAWGRLAGFYTDYNYGGLIVANAIFSGLYLLCNNKCNKITYRAIIILGIIVDYIYIFFTDSRGTMLSILCSMLLVGILYSFKICKKSKKTMKAITITVVSLVMVICSNYATKVLYSNIFEKSNKTITHTEYTEKNIESNNQNLNSYVAETENMKLKNQVDTDYAHNYDEKIEENYEVNSVDNVVDDLNKKSKETSVLNRQDGSDIDISNRRFDLWNSSIDIFKMSPITGVGFENLVEYAKANIPTTYLINNDYTVFYNFHNIFFNILAGQGVIGIICFTILLIMLFVDFIKGYKYLEKCQVMLMGSIISNVIEGFLLIGDIIYFFTPNAIMFWLVMGLLYSNRELRKEENDGCICDDTQKN